jgi:hypothetical protein
LTRRTLECPYANVPETAVVDVDVLRRILSFHLDAIRSAVREGEAGEGDAFAATDMEEIVVLCLAIPPLTAEGNLGRVSGGATNGNVLLLLEDNFCWRTITRGSRY